MYSLRFYFNNIQQEKILYILLFFLGLIGAAAATAYNFLTASTTCVDEPPTQEPSTEITLNSAIAPPVEFFDETLMHLIRQCDMFVYQSAMLAGGSSFTQLFLSIRNMLPYSFNLERLRKILQKGIEIIIVPRNYLFLHNGDSSFHMLDNLQKKPMIFIAQNPYLTETHVKQILSNELHHASIFFTNLMKLKSSQNINPPHSKILLPFLKENFEIDLHLQHQHQKALQAGFDEIKQFKNLLKIQKKGVMSEIAKAKLNYYMKAIETYEPIVYQDRVSKKDYEHFIKPFIQKIPFHGRQKLIGPEEIIYISKVFERDNEVEFRYTLAASNQKIHKAEAFFGDMVRCKKQIFQHYSVDSSPEQQQKEMSSFIEEFSGLMKKTFFAQWCEYFEIYTETNNYCDRPQRLSR